MKIACIGWGSLIWRPKALQIQNKWFDDGPMLPIEFTRISNDNRVTLIIDKDAALIRTLWSLMIPKLLTECIASLTTREGTNKTTIHHVSITDTTTDSIKTIVKEWLLVKNLDSAIWTGLSFSKKTNEKRPDIETIIEHLGKLEGNERRNAEEYIRKAPKQIDTSYRRKIEAKFGWTYVE